jgi:SP family general alpha glucoside:H+ symporter-like MFS transporter
MSSKDSDVEVGVRLATLEQDGQNFAAISREHALGPKQAFKEQWRSVLWSAILSLSIVMYGYDNSLIGNFWAYPSFQKKYGTYYKSIGGYQIPAEWQTALPNASTVGTFIGALINGYLSSRFGYRVIMLISLAFMTAAIFIPFFAPSISVLLVGELICGLPWGIFSTTGPSYSSELLPTSLRGFMTGYANLFIVIGQLISSGVLAGLESNKTSLSYRVPFAIQWVWPVPLFILIIFAPESPWWLVRKGKLHEAEQVLRRVTTMDEDAIKNQLAMMVHTTSMEREVQESSSYVECFKGPNLHRTEVASLVFFAQAFSGASMVGSYFFNQVGLSAYTTYRVLVADSGIAFIASIVGSFAISRFGRRKIFNGGMFFMAFLLFIIGILAIPKNKPGAKWGQIGLALFWVFIYQSTIGVGAYTVSSEISAVRLRVQTVAIAKNSHNIANIIVSILEPRMINPSAWHWKGYTAFFWAGTCLAFAVWGYFRIPETFGRTYQELDLLFEKKVSSRKFDSFDLNLTDDSVKDEKL